MAILIIEGLSVDIAICDKGKTILDFGPYFVDLLKKKVSKILKFFK